MSSREKKFLYFKINCMFLSDHMFDGNRRFAAKDIATQIRRRDRNKGNLNFHHIMRLSSS